MSEVDDLVAQMTLEEKAALCVGTGPGSTAGVPRLGIPAVRMADGPHGVRLLEPRHDATAPEPAATCFPTAACLAASWDTELLRTVGEALGAEAAAAGVDVLLGPAVNIKRTPLCGRNFEYFSEDPFLAGELAVAYIEGLQSRGVGASLKHFAANNQEFQRRSIDAVLDERTLREIYLPAFEAAVRRARPWTVMSAYNSLNGELCYENRSLLSDILKAEWGFDGAVVSDWDSVRDIVVSLEAGLDVEMPGPKGEHVARIVAAVEDGSLSRERLDDAAARLVALALRARGCARGGDFDREAHHRLAQRAAAEGMVLLKNTGALPLQGLRHVAVIGRSARVPHIQGGGAAYVTPQRLEVPLDALRARAPEVRFEYSEGWIEDAGQHGSLLAEAAERAAEAEAAVVFTALPAPIESEGYDRSDLRLPEAQADLVRVVAEAQPRTVVVINSGAPIDVSSWIDGVPALLQAYTMGQAGGAALADVLLGRASPGGKLAESFPAVLQDTAAFLDYPGENGRARYGEGLFVGYRHHDARGVPARFPFGHGLAYTTFGYRDLDVSPTSFSPGDVVRVALTVSNDGDMDGAEIVQVYVRDPEARLRRPQKELKGFARVTLAPGEARRIDLSLDERAFRYYDPAYARWVLEPGEFRILVGASSTDIRLEQRITLARGTPLPSRLDGRSTLREWLADASGREVLEPHLESIHARVAQGMAGDAGATRVRAMDLAAFAMDMPLLTVLRHGERAGGPSPEDELAGYQRALAARTGDAAYGGLP